MTTTSGQTAFGPTAHCFQNSAALLGRHRPHARADRSLQLGNVSGSLLYVGSFLDMTPEVEVRRREVRRPRWPPGGGASGDEPPTEALLQPLEGHSGCMSGGTILLQPLLVDGVHTLPLERSPELLEHVRQIALRHHRQDLARVIFDQGWAAWCACCSQRTMQCIGAGAADLLRPRPGPSRSRSGCPNQIQIQIQVWIWILCVKTTELVSK